MPYYCKEHKTSINFGNFAILSSNILYTNILKVIFFYFGMLYYCHEYEYLDNFEKDLSVNNLLTCLLLVFIHLSAFGLVVFFNICILVSYKRLCDEYGSIEKCSTIIE